MMIMLSSGLAGAALNSNSLGIDRGYWGRPQLLAEGVDGLASVAILLGLAVAGLIFCARTALPRSEARPQGEPVYGEDDPELS